jgi:glycosyltransferase involved in cell wall biosynthesis
VVGVEKSGMRPLMFDIEFSLALHNRTGKYFLGRDLIKSHAQYVKRVRYWRFVAARPPAGVIAKIIGRALAVELSMRTGQSNQYLLPRLRPVRPVLHLDPFTLLLYRTQPTDLILWHDMGPISCPELFAPSVTALYRAVYNMVAQCSPNVVFVSRATEAAFHHGFVGKLASSRVIYPAIRTDMGEERQAHPIHGLTRPFLLTVGNVGARKNQLRSIRAFERSSLAKAGIEYVICGGREPGYDAVAEAASRTGGVRMLGYVSDAQLAWLYRHAKGLVLCSLLEGFGLPVAEAIAHGQIPLVSRDTVLQEVAGNAAFFSDPMDIDEMAAAMVKLAHLSKEERESRCLALQNSARRFTPQQNHNAWSALFEEIGELAATRSREATGADGVSRVGATRRNVESSG